MFESTFMSLVVVTCVTFIFICTTQLRNERTLRDIDSPQIVFNELSQQDLRSLSTPQVRDDVSFLYIVGIEGVGHHGVTPAIMKIAKSCHYQVEKRNFRMQIKQAAHDWKYIIDKQHNNSANLKVLLMDDQSFPARTECRSCTAQQIKALPEYNLESLYVQAQAENIHIRFLHLTRDYYSTISSHADFDGGFEMHAKVMQRFLKHIEEEYTRIATRQMGLWTTVHYEWFRDLDNCAALVSGIIEFAEWRHCNVATACELLQRDFRNSTFHPINEANLEYLKSLDMNTTIPVMKYV